MVIQKSIYILRNREGIVGAFASKNLAEEARFLRGGEVEKKHIPWKVRNSWIE